MKKKETINQQAASAEAGILERRKPLVIAGPCSAETRDQVLATASALALDDRVAFFRAGIWKPRTNPGSFQGVGAEGLSWLREVKQRTGLKVTTEVGSPKHVEEALKNGVDMLWIGARTVSNPFVIQDIADALGGVDIPVLIKNPLSPDIDLWEGAINRMLKSGVRQTGAIHRGFFWWGKSSMRNQPFWHIPMELRRRMPQLPILCDPSHIGGKRSLVALLAQRAMEHQFSGLMIEVHPDPDSAWSDAMQQITPQSFRQLMDELFGENLVPSPTELLDELRAEVDTMDEMLVWALSIRMELAGKIARVKKDAGMESLQNGRWNQVLGRVKMLAKQSDIDPRFIEDLYNIIHHQSLNLQNNLLHTNGAKIKKEPNFVL
ncbi:MAG: chorismate mutase [Bacteroidota bacterium]